MAYITYGPCLRTHDPILEKALIAGLKQHARNIGVRFMVAGLPYNGHFLEPGLVAAGFQHKPVRFHPHFIEATAVINLSPEPEQILSAMQLQQTAKTSVKPLKRGITVVEQGEDGLRSFHRLMCEFVQAAEHHSEPC